MGNTVGGFVLTGIAVLLFGINLLACGICAHHFVLCPKIGMSDGKLQIGISTY